MDRLTPEEFREFLLMRVAIRYWRAAYDAVTDAAQPFWDAQHQTDDPDEYTRLDHQRCRAALAAWREWTEAHPNDLEQVERVLWEREPLLRFQLIERMPVVDLTAHTDL
jgi:CBS-domain-containing membrane protein